MFEQCRIVPAQPMPKVLVPRPGGCQFRSTRIPSVEAIE